MLFECLGENYCLFGAKMHKVGIKLGRSNPDNYLLNRDVPWRKRDVLRLVRIQALYSADCDVKHGVGQADRSQGRQVLQRCPVGGFRKCERKKQIRP